MRVMIVRAIPFLRTGPLLAAALAVSACDTRPSAADYAAYQAALIAEGDLRVETAPPDAPFGPRELAINFERVALHHEADISEVGGERNWAENPLVRWEEPIHWQMFGAGVAEEDRAEVRRLMRRLSALTGLEIVESDREVNFTILITEPGERNAFAELLRARHPALGDIFRLWRHTPEVVCVATNLFSTENQFQIAQTLVAMGSEVRGLLRQACLHEEIVQSLGLGNDHPEVRPSIFNDDGEFALMTKHDEQLLRILYDPRLEIGMTAEQAMPIVRRIVAGLDMDTPNGRMAAQVKAAN